MKNTGLIQQKPDNAMPEDNHGNPCKKNENLRKKSITHLSMRIEMLPFNHMSKHNKHSDSKKPGKNLPWIRHNTRDPIAKNKNPI